MFGLKKIVYNNEFKNFDILVFDFNNSEIIAKNFPQS